MVDPAVELEATKAALQALQPLDKEQASRALRWLAEVLDVSLIQTTSFVASTPPVASPGPVSAPAYAQTSMPYASPAMGGEPPSPEEFLATKRPKTNAERVACLGFYLSEYRGTPHFKTTDIVALNTEAAQSRMLNAARDLDNAERSSGYLASAGTGKKQISSRGKALVRALPSREDVEAALKDYPIRRRKVATKKATSPKKTSGTTPDTSRRGAKPDAKAGEKLEKP
jgi:hypothetical protein